MTNARFRLTLRALLVIVAGLGLLAAPIGGALGLVFGIGVLAFGLLLLASIALEESSGQENRKLALQLRILMAVVGASMLAAFATVLLVPRVQTARRLADRGKQAVATVRDSRPAPAREGSFDYLIRYDGHSTWLTSSAMRRRGDKVSVIYLPEDAETVVEAETGAGFVAMLDGLINRWAALGIAIAGGFMAVVAVAKTVQLFLVRAPLDDTLDLRGRG